MFRVANLWAGRKRKLLYNDEDIFKNVFMHYYSMLLLTCSLKKLTINTFKKILQDKSFLELEIELLYVWCDICMEHILLCNPGDQQRRIFKMFSISEKVAVRVFLSISWAGSFLVKNYIPFVENSLSRNMSTNFWVLPFLSCQTPLTLCLLSLVNKSYLYFMS